VVVAALSGALGAAVLVGWWLPADTGAPLREVVVPVAVPETPVVAVRPSPSPAPALPRPSPVREPAEPELEGPTADNRQWFRVQIVDADGSPVVGGHVAPVACDGFDYDRETGLHSAFAPQDCTLEAMKKDGMLRRRSEQETLRLVAGADPQRVRLELPEERTGGIGVRFLPISTGMRVVSVVEGGPAWEAGLEVGDVIVSVDGEAVDGLDTEEFVRRMTGPEGSSVDFEILYSDTDQASQGQEQVVEQVRVRRRYLDG
jgi:membrane-associated protease RseP (regulator of RpoE activity)